MTQDLMESDEEKEKEEKNIFYFQNRNDGFDDHSDYSVFLHYVDGRENTGNGPRCQLCRSGARKNAADYQAGGCGRTAGYDDCRHQRLYRRSAERKQRAGSGAPG